MLIGAILPDVTWFVMWPLLLVGIPTSFVYSFVLPFHTPFLMLIFCLIIALFLKDVRGGFILLYLGTISHFILDISEYGNYVTLLYPFDISPVSLNLFAINDDIGYILYVFLFFALLCAIIKPCKTNLHLTFRNASVLLFPLLLLIPLSTCNYVSNDFFYFDFANHSDHYDGRTILLANRPIISSNPLAIDVLGKKLNIETNSQFEVGNHITVEGVYNLKRNILLNTKVHLHNDFLKPIGSAIGFILLVILCFRTQNLIFEKEVG